MRALKSRVVALGGAVILILTACGGGGGGITKPVDPVSGVATAFDVANAGGTLKKMALTNCLVSGGGSSLTNSLISQFSSMSKSSLNAAGITTADLDAAWKVSFSDLSTKEVTRSGGTATVHVGVKVSTELDPTKMRDLVKKSLGTRGVVPDDATIDAQIKTQVNGQFSQSVTISKDINVTLQNDNWVACGSEFAYPTAS
jgi:hypothetical protein